MFYKLGSLASSFNHIARVAQLTFTAGEKKSLSQGLPIFNYVHITIKKCNLLNRERSDEKIKKDFCPFSSNQEEQKR